MEGPVGETCGVFTLALDIDGVLLDPDRGGAGHWTNELTARFGITRDEFRRAFFMTAWDDVVNGRRPIEPAVAAALEVISSTATVEDVLACWFEADYVPIDAAIGFAQRAVASGTRVVLVTNQEHRRARFLTERLGAVFKLDGIVYSADVGAQKHEAEFFNVASERLGIPPDRRAGVLFVDDRVGNVRQANVSGWTAIHADAGGAWIGEAERVLGIS